MKINKKATSIAEAMVVLVVILIAITGAYNLFFAASNLTQSNEYKLQAIASAKEGIEAVTNIRDTNWKLLPGDVKNCWNTIDYQIDCYNDPLTTYDIPEGSYYLSLSGSTLRWELNPVATGVYEDSSYRDRFQVGLDSNGFYYQNGSAIPGVFPVFTREIKIKYLDDGITGGTVDSNHQKMQVTSLVQWKDNSSDNIKKVEIITVLTNWEDKVN